MNWGLFYVFWNAVCAVGLPVSTYYFLFNSLPAMIGNEERIASKGMFKLEELFIDFLLLQSGCIRISNAENWVFAGAVSV